MQDWGWGERLRDGYVVFFLSSSGPWCRYHTHVSAAQLPPGTCLLSAASHNGLHYYDGRTKYMVCLCKCVLMTLHHCSVLEAGREASKQLEKNVAGRRRQAEMLTGQP